MEQHLKAMAKTLEELFCENKEYKIPYNQRPWSWAKKQIIDLWHDVDAIFNRIYSADHAGLWEKNQDYHDLSHFMGSLVLVDNDPSFNVVDGQQRLTALSLFISEIRKIANEAISNTSNGEEKRNLRLLGSQCERLLYNISGNESTAFLQLDDVYEEAYQKCVIDSCTHEEYLENIATFERDYTESTHIKRFIHSIKQIRSIMEEFVEGLSGTQLNNKLFAVLDVIIHHLDFILIKVEDEAYSFEVFKSLNARGMPLLPTDNIKNELFIISKRSDHSAIKSKWDSMCKKLPLGDIQQFLWFRHLAYVGPCSKSKLYDETKNEVLNKLSAPHVIRELDLWNQQASKMELISLNRHGHYSEETEAVLDELRKLKITYGWIFCLAAADVFDNDETKFRSAIRLTVNFCFRYLTICQKDVSELEQKLSSAARKLLQDKSLTNVRKLFVDASPDDDFKEAFSTASINDTVKQFYVLRELEKELLRQSGSGALVPDMRGNERNNIEHIMPRKFSGADTRVTEWEWARNNPDSHRKYLHRVGNLMLLEGDINSDVSSYDYEAKLTGNYPGAAATKKGLPRKSYLNSAFEMPKRLVSDYNEWSFSSIDERQKELADLALNVWKLS